MSASQYGHHKVVQLLLDRGAQSDLENNDGSAALDLANHHIMKTQVSPQSISITA